MRRILRLPAVMDRTGLSRSGVYADRELSAARVKIGVRAAGWPEDRVESWIAARAGESIAA